jgi:hypothetical protein
VETESEFDVHVGKAPSGTRITIGV